MSALTQAEAVEMLWQVFEADADDVAETEVAITVYGEDVHHCRFLIDDYLREVLPHADPDLIEVKADTIDECPMSIATAIKVRVAG